MLSYTIQDHLTSSATSHTELGPPTLIINQENAPQSCLQANLMEAVSQLQSLFLQMSRFVLTETNLHTLPAELLASKEGTVISFGSVTDDEPTRHFQIVPSL